MKTHCSKSNQHIQLMRTNRAAFFSSYEHILHKWGVSPSTCWHENTAKCFNFEWSSNLSWQERLTLFGIPYKGTVFIRISALGAYLILGLLRCALIRGGRLLEARRFLGLNHFQPYIFVKFIWSLTIAGSLESLKRRITRNRKRSPDRWKVFPYNRWDNR